MACTITGLFDTREAAEATVRHLVEEDGIDRDRVRLHGVEDRTSGTTTDSGDQGVWASLKNLFMPDEDRYAYSEGIRRGGIVVSVEVDDSHAEHAMDVFEANGAADLDSREAEWRSSGWTGYTADTGAVSPAYAAGGMSMAGSDPGGAGTTGAATGTPMASTSTPAGSDMAGTDMAGTGRSGTDVTGTGVAGADVTGDRTIHTAATGTGTTGLGMAEPDRAGRTGSEDVIPVVEEQLHVGKRDMERGRVRVRSYIQEQPVSENVLLRQEHVNVERRTVDRPLTDADDAFRERSIEAVEHNEEAVVSKEARVVEEVTINKDVSQREETVRDTVRRQDVEVEDSREGTTTPMPRNPA
ncbi:MAG TPA: YsnF/AvaK domain-containing protein [Roseomonas sp.]|nr:YsnF/AvaK domain-containing protein [Roseomonas sp.]